MEAQTSEVHLRALIMVTKAIDQNLVSKRSLSGVERVIQNDLCESLSQAFPHMRKTLPEEIQDDSGPIKAMRDLPLPAHTRWDCFDGLQACEEYQRNVLWAESRVWLTDDERYSNLPQQIREKE